jgi:hypothetical protein
VHKLVVVKTSPEQHNDVELQPKARKFCNEDDLLVSLGNYGALLQRLQAYLPVMVVSVCSIWPNAFIPVHKVSNCVQERDILPVHPLPVLPVEHDPYKLYE